MNTEPIRAWRFVHPDEQISGGQTGLTISAQGRIQLVQGDEAVRQGILLLLSTKPGERVGRPDYGCPLDRLVFSPNDDTTAGLAMHYVRQALDRWEPRIEIIRLDAGPNPEVPEVMDIYLQYRIRATNNERAILSSLNLQEAEV